MAGIELTKKRRIWRQNGEVKNDPLRDYTGTITSGGNPNYEYIEEDDVNNMSNHLPALPSEGEWVEENKTYSYGSDIVKARQGHYRTIYEPSQTPALFSFVRSGTDLQWIEGEEVGKGMIRVYEGQEYECIQAHQTQSDWTPDSTPSLWEEYSQDEYPEWEQPTGAHNAYNTGDIVTLNGVLYKSRIDANTTNPEQYNDTDSPLNYWDKEPFDE